MKDSRDLSTCSSQEIKTFLDSFDDILLDCDGVIFNMIKLIPGVRETINCFRNHGKAIKVVTDNCTRTSEHWEHLFQKHNLDCSVEDVIYPTYILLDYFREIKFNKKAFVLGSPAIEKMLTDAGFEIYEYKQKQRYDVPEAIAALTEESSIGAVLIEWDINLTYMKWMKAAAVLKNPDVLFICLANNKHIPLPAIVSSIGPYFISTALEFMTGRTAWKICKPNPPYVNYMQRKYNFNPSRTLFVGDTLESDMAFAANNGFQKLLVLTGTSTLVDLKTCEDHIKPKYYLKSLGDFHKIV